MRRLVDSILFVLVAYTITWPVVRNFVPADAAESVVVDLRGELGRHMSVRFAVDEAAAASGRWIETIRGPMESPIVRLGGMGQRNHVWVALQLGDRLLPPYAIDIARGRGKAHACVDIPFHDDDSANALIETAPR